MRKPRTDGQRNRLEILRVARRHFKDHGVTAPLDAIAKDAGVGAGTLYRHFPTRDDLVAALVRLRDEETVARIDAIREGDEPLAQLREWQHALEDYLDTFNGLPDPMGKALADDASPLSVSCDWLITTTTSFLRAAQQEGRVRQDLTGRDLFLTALAMTWVKRSGAADDAAVSAVRSIVDQGIVG